LQLRHCEARQLPCACCLAKHLIQHPDRRTARLTDRPAAAAVVAKPLSSFSSLPGVANQVVSRQPLLSAPLLSIKLAARLLHGPGLRVSTNARHWLVDSCWRRLRLVQHRLLLPLLCPDDSTAAKGHALPACPRLH
jgi:hypothetical protein